MKFGFYTPNFDFCGDARVLAELAHEAEQAGWDGYFVWDHLQFGEPTADPWVSLAAIALRTRQIRLGPLVTPVPRRHIAKLAREVITLDHLSGGRVVLGVGAGFAALPDYSAFGDDAEPRRRAEKLDEALELLAQLFGGQAVKHSGVHYRVECAAFQPTLQRPRVPVWVAASWPSRRPLDRAARWDGVVPCTARGLEIEPADLAEIASYTRERRRSTGEFDVVRFGRTRDRRDTGVVEACAAAGATWWIDYVYTWESSLAATRARIAAGPPRP
jgi:alkanesulfonate monooxygenase SsuD/methylene tetrahydromethanopterin reductase-like flavin-dependent oxidoreductase (luciferase family)